MKFLCRAPMIPFLNFCKNVANVPFYFSLSITYMRCSCADYNRYHKRHKYLSLHGWPVLSPFSGSYRELSPLSHSECCISQIIYEVCAQIGVCVCVCVFMCVYACVSLNVPLEFMEPTSLEKPTHPV